MLTDLGITILVDEMEILGINYVCDKTKVSISLTKLTTIF